MLVVTPLGVPAAWCPKSREAGRVGCGEGALVVPVWWRRRCDPHGVKLVRG